MGNSTNLSSDITAARTSVAAASNAILTNTVQLTSAAKDFVTIVEKMEQRFKELEEKESQLAKKQKELDEKLKSVSKIEEREAILIHREQKVAEQEKLWTELKKVMESNPASSSPKETSTSAPLSSSSAGSRSPRERERKGSFSSAEPPHLIKRTISEVSIVEPPALHIKRAEVITPEPPQLLKRDNTPTPEPTIPSNLLSLASDSFKIWFQAQTFSLAYKATRDGFGRADFHRLCDNKGPTVSLILSDKGHLFGGYAPISWGRTFEGYDTHPDCFLFTISNPHNIPPTQYKLRNGNAYGLRNGQHVSFGWCGDIRVADDNAHMTHESTSNFPRSFIDTTGKGNVTFTGEYKFRVIELETYLVM